jgi:hypothetical protein
MAAGITVVAASKFVPDSGSAMSMAETRLLGAVESSISTRAVESSISTRAVDDGHCWLSEHFKCVIRVGDAVRVRLAARS